MSGEQFVSPSVEDDSAISDQAIAFKLRMGSFWSDRFVAADCALSVSAEETLFFSNHLPVLMAVIDDDAVVRWWSIQ